MRAILQLGYGDADVLTYSGTVQPTIDRDEVLIRLHAVGMDRGTWHLMAGLPYAVRLASGLRHPKVKVPGLDVAGVVEAVGPAVTRFRPGDQVFGVGRARSPSTPPRARTSS